MSTPPPAYQTPYGPSVPVVRPRATSTKGPKITVAIGVLALIVAIAAGVAGTRTFIDIMPTDVMRLDGSPGPGVVGDVEAPGTTEVQLAPDTTYAVLLVRDDGGQMALSAEPVVTSASGTDVNVGGPGVSLTVTMGSSHAEAIASLRTKSGGQYRIDAPTTLDGGPASLYLVESDGVGAFIGGMFGSIAGVLVAVFLGLTAVVLLITGGILWGVRRGNARAADLR